MIGEPNLHRYCLVAAGALSGAVPACGAADERVASQVFPIEGGEVDTQHEEVFRVITRNDGFNGLCSSTLIAPNLLITARHCVAQNDGSDVVCGETRFGATTSSGNLLFSNDVEPSLSSRWFEAEAIIVDDRSNQFCGNDVALVRLTEPVPTSVAEPVVPRIDTAVEVGENYVAVGYGGNAADPEAAAYGTRRFRNDLPIDCIGGVDCQEDVLDGEFAGFEGVCRGDSGGPAIDLQRRLIGVLSRGLPGCRSPVYMGLGHLDAWLRAQAEEAALSGDYPLPLWAGGTSGVSAPDTVDAGSSSGSSSGKEPELATEAGCSTGRAGTQRTAEWWSLLLLAWAGFARRRR